MFHEVNSVLLWASYRVFKQERNKEMKDEKGKRKIADKRLPVGLPRRAYALLAIDISRNLTQTYKEQIFVDTKTCKTRV